MDRLGSVIIPTYNRKALTDMAVASVVTAFPSLIEIVVVDDGGSDAYSFAASNPSGVPVHIIRLDRNVGPGMARQAGIAQASGRFIAFLDSDDRFDAGWIDHVVTLLQKEPVAPSRQILISGITLGSRRVGAATRRLLSALPEPLQLIGCRSVATLFNPFYTPSLVISRDLYFSQDGLRYCEDYYSTAFALFGADIVFLPQAVACHLGRVPNSAGGISADRKKMFNGEMQVRFALLREAGIPFGYKLLMPVGMAYQWCRSAAKGTWRILKP